MEEFRNIAVVERFNKLEYIKGVYLHKEQLTIESGLVTPTMKLKVTSRKPLAGQFIITLIFFQRFEMQRYFAKIIEELYKHSQY